VKLIFDVQCGRIVRTECVPKDLT